MSTIRDRFAALRESRVAGPAIRVIEGYPRLSAWVVLSVGMGVLLVIEARDVGLLPTQWAALIVATVLVAGASIWIISWEDEEEMVDEEG